jgi:hypothetical protein
MSVTHEALSVSIMFRPTIVFIVREVFLFALSQLRPITGVHHHLVGITVFDCEQLVMLLR